MSTRSLTNVYGEDDECIVTMYRQMDGYPEGHGMDLAEFLSNRTVVNGLRLDISPTERFSNGPNCLAAQIVAHFKGDGPAGPPAGGFYLYPAGSNDHGEEYIYNVYSKYNKPIRVIIHDVWNKIDIFNGNVEELMVYCSDPLQDSDGNYIIFGTK